MKSLYDEEASGAELVPPNLPGSDIHTMGLRLSRRSLPLPLPSPLTFSFLPSLFLFLHPLFPASFSVARSLACSTRTNAHTHTLVASLSRRVI